MKSYRANLKIAVFITVFIILMKVCLVFLWPFVIALLLVILVEPIISFFRNFGFSRKISLLISLLMIITLLVLSCLIISALFIKGTINFNDFPKWVEDLLSKTEILKRYHIDYPKIIDTLKNLFIEYREKIIKTLLSTFSGFLYSFVIIFTAVLISLDLDLIIENFRYFFPRDIFEILKNTIINLERMLILEVKLIVSTILVSSLGFWFLGYKGALTMGIICGILDLLPIVGPSLLFIPICLYEYLSGRTMMSLSVIFLFILMEIIRQFLEIRMMGSNLKLHPVITIFSIYTGILFFGAFGVMAGPVTAIYIKEIYKFFFRKETSNLR